MKRTYFSPHTILSRYGLATFFQIAFVALVLVAVELIVILLEQRELTARSMLVPGCVLVLLVVYRLSYRVVVKDDILLRIPFARRYKVKDIIGVVYGAQMGVGLVLYNVKCFLADGSHVLLSVNQPDELVEQLRKLNPDLLCSIV